MTRRFVHHEFAEWRRPRFRRQIGSYTINRIRNVFIYDLGRFSQVEIAGFDEKLETSESDTKQWRKKQVPRVKSKESLRCLRCEESGRKLSLESQCTLMLFP